MRPSLWPYRHYRWGWKGFCGRFLGRVLQCFVDRMTNLLREVLGAQEEAEKTSDNHGQHWEDQQAVLLTNSFHSHPHCIQRHGHRVSHVHKTPATLADLHISTTQIQMGERPTQMHLGQSVNKKDNCSFAQNMGKTLILFLSRLSFFPMHR